MKACPAGCDGGYFDNGTCVADTCDRCEGEGRVESWYDRLPGARGLRRQWHVRRYMLDRRLERARHWRALLREHKAWKAGTMTTSAAYTVVHKSALDDEPLVRSLVQNELMHQLRDFTPLLWRLDVIRRAWKGDLEDPYDYPTSVAVRTDHSDFFQRNQAMLLAERRRVPKSARVIRVDAPLTAEEAAELRGDVPCPNDGELVNVRCWRCGWVRPT